MYIYVYMYVYIYIYVCMYSTFHNQHDNPKINQISVFNCSSSAIWSLRHAPGPEIWAFGRPCVRPKLQELAYKWYKWYGPMSYKVSPFMLWGKGILFHRFFLMAHAHTTLKVEDIHEFATCKTYSKHSTHLASCQVMPSPRLVHTTRQECYWKHAVLSFILQLRKLERWSWPTCENHDDNIVHVDRIDSPTNLFRSSESTHYINRSK